MINKENMLKITFILVLMIITLNLPDLTINFLKKHKILDKIEYQYIAIINNEEVVANYCNVNGSVYCKFNDYTYYNVPYKKIEINRIENYYLDTYTIIIVVFGLVLLLNLSMLLIKIFLLTLKEKEF